MRTNRAIVVATLCVALAAACSGDDDATSTGASTTTAPPESSTDSTLVEAGDPDEKLNPIPFALAASIGLPGDLVARVDNVRLGYSDPTLPALDPAQQYVAVDVSVVNGGQAALALRADLFGLYDPSNTAHEVTGAPAWLDAPVAPGASATGPLVFAVPADAPALRLIFEGQEVGSKRSMWQVHPEEVAGEDVYLGDTSTTSD